MRIPCRPRTTNPVADEVKVPSVRTPAIKTVLRAILAAWTWSIRLPKQEWSPFALTVLGGTDVAVDVNTIAMSVNGKSRVDRHAVESLDMAEL
jgi:hypothetical protein